MCDAHNDRDLRHSASQRLASHPHLPEYLDMRSRWHDAGYRYIRSRIWDDVEASDVCLAAWAKLWEKMPDYEPDRNTKGEWVFFWARFMVLQHLVAKYRQVRLVEALASLEPRFERDPMLDWDPLFDWDLLRFTLGGDDPPHHVLAFLLCKVLEWKPQEVVGSLSRLRLRELVADVEDMYIRESRLAAELVRDGFDLLRARMDLPVAKVMPAQELAAYTEAFLMRAVGDTRLPDYLTGAATPAASISNWWYSERRRLVKRALETFRDDGDANGGLTPIR